MTTSGDIASVETKLDLSRRNAIPQFSSYLDKLLKTKKEAKKTNKTSKTNSKAEMPVFKTKKNISEDTFYELQKIIRDNKVDIRDVYISESPLITETHKGIVYKKTIKFYSLEDCLFVFEGFKDYDIELKKDNNSIVFNHFTNKLY